MGLAGSCSIEPNTPIAANQFNEEHVALGPPTPEQKGRDAEQRRSGLRSARGIGEQHKITRDGEENRGGNGSEEERHLEK